MVLALCGGCFSDPEPVSSSCPAGSPGCPAGETDTSDPDTGTSTSTSTSTGPSTTGTSTSSADDTGDPDTTAATSETDTSGNPNTCGDGVLDDDEECDGTPGCSDRCELESDAYECNPINNAPCPTNFKCSIIEPVPGNVQTLCLPVPGSPLVDGTDAPPPGGIHESNCVYGGAPHDEWCEIGLACAYSSFTNACDVNCCVEFCDLTNPISCAWEADECQPFFQPGIPAGLAHLGWCVRP